MALPLPAGLTPAEVAFVCEMELVTVVPRQRLDSITLLGGETPALRPPHRADLPLWLALLLKKQRRANIVPPPWLAPASLQELIHYETHADPENFSPPPPPAVRADARGNARRVRDLERDEALSAPFLPSCTAAAPAGFLPYHWLEMAEALLAHAPDDMPAPAGEVRGLLRDLAEVRAAKMRARTATTTTTTTTTSTSTSAPAGRPKEEQSFGGAPVTNLRGVGAMELAENRGFVLGVVDGVRKLGASAEATRREEEEEMALAAEDESDEDMGI